MSEITLDDVKALNAELAALTDAGIPMNLVPGASRNTVARALKEIDNSLASRSASGQSLLAVASKSQDLPPIYRSALEVGLQSSHLSATLDAMSRPAAAENELRSTVGRALVPPLIVLALAYAGFVLLSLYYLPTLEGMYEQVGEPPSRPVARLVAMRNWLPYWATLSPLLLLGGVILWRRGWGDWQHLVPGAARYASAVRNATFANHLALLIDSDAPLATSLPLAAAVTGDSGLIAASSALSQAAAQQERLPADTEVLRALPPLLRWALTGDLGHQSLPEILRFAEKTYRHTAERRLVVWRFLLPAIIGALLGGSIVLIYGLSVFSPFIRLLEDLSY